MDQIDDYTVRLARTEAVDFEQLKEALPATVVLQLVNPKKLKGGETNELTFAESTGKHIDRMNKAGTERAQHTVGVEVICECCGIGPDEYEMLGTRDIARLNQVLTYFLGFDSPQTASARP